MSRTGYSSTGKYSRKLKSRMVDEAFNQDNGSIKTQIKRHACTLLPDSKVDLLWL